MKVIMISGSPHKEGSSRLALREMRGHVACYVRGLHGAARIRERVNAASTYAQLRECLADLS